MRIVLQYFLDLQCQAVHPTSHVGVADGQPNANSRWDRDHRPDSALTTAMANPAGIEAGIRTRAFPANSISIAGATGHRASSPTRRDHDLGETAAAPQQPAPAINLARSNIHAPSNLGDHRPRRQALRNNRPLLLGAPTPPPLWASNDLNPRHRTVSNTKASTVACTSAYQPEPKLICKTALTGRLRWDRRQHQSKEQRRRVGRSSNFSSIK